MSAVIECRSCGHQNDDGAQFCESCHAFLEWQGTRRAERPQSAVTVTLDSRSLQVEPGGRAECRLRIRNNGTIVDELRLEVVGGAATWATVDPPILRLFPSTTEVARVTFSPPKSPSVAAGPTRFGVKVTSTVRPEAYTVENDLLDVGSFEDWTAELAPQTSRSDGPATHQVRVQNRGNVPLQVAVTARSPDDSLTVEGAPASLTVPPGQSAEATLTLRPREAAPRDGERAHPFQAVVESLEGRRQALDGTVLQRAREARVEWYARLVPPAGRAAGSTDHQVQVLNRGEEPLTVGIEAQDPSGALLLHLSGPSLTVAPGAEAGATLRVTPAEPASRGPERQRPFQVVVTGPGGRRSTLDGLLVQLPAASGRGRRGRVWVALVALLVLAGALAAVVAFNPFARTPAGPPVQVTVLDEIGTSRCETSETVEVVIDGQSRGTLRVDNAGRTDDTLRTTVSGTGSHDYSLTATGKFTVQGRTFTLQGGGNGKIDLSGGPKAFAVEVDEKVLPARQCPSQNGSWPLLLQPQ